MLPENLKNLISQNNKSQIIYTDKPITSENLVDFDCIITVLASKAHYISGLFFFHIKEL